MQLPGVRPTRTRRARSTSQLLPDRPVVNRHHSVPQQSSRRPNRQQLDLRHPHRLPQ
ncbi:MAG: hypothetical protein KME22_13510 [Hassallia sp. WJT32-NPBG1]|nr:hypothetical protein [Hassallia sp. WJT32-NPBG1]